MVKQTDPKYWIDRILDNGDIVTEDYFNETGYHEFTYAMSKPEVREADIMYYALGLTAEAGEVAGEVCKSMHKDGRRMSEIVRNGMTPERKARIMDELGDVFFYAFALCDVIGCSFEDCIRMNINKLVPRNKEYLEMEYGNGVSKAS